MNQTKFAFPKCSGEDFYWRLITEEAASNIVEKNSQISENFFRNPIYHFDAYLQSENPLDEFPFDKLCYNVASSKIAIKRSLQKPLKLKKNEAKSFFGALILMQDYHYYDYKSHFDLDSNFMSSILPKIMPLTRFECIKNSISLSNGVMNENFIQSFNDFLCLFEKQNYQPTEYLIMKIKNLKCHNLKFLALYDEKGYFLKGRIFEDKYQNDFKMFLKVLLNFLEFLFNKNHTIILPEELLSLKFVENLQKKKINCLCHFKKKFNVYKLPNILPILENEKFFEKPTICKNEKNDSLFLRKINPSENSVEYLYIGSFQFPQGLENKYFFEEAVEKINKIQSSIKKQWKISVWKEFDQNSINWTFQLIMIALQTIINNSYIASAGKFDDFNKFKEKIVKFLLKHKNGIFSAKTTIKKPFFETSFCHYPVKMEHCKKCVVCKKDSVKKRKSLYKCKKCSIDFNKDIPLCAHNCMAIYHENPEKYNARKKKSK